MLKMVKGGKKIYGRRCVVYIYGMWNYAVFSLLNTIMIILNICGECLAFL